MHFQSYMTKGVYLVPCHRNGLGDGLYQKGVSIKREEDVSHRVKSRARTVK